MKFFDKWFYSKCRWAWKRAEQEHPDWKRHEDLLDRLSDYQDDDDDAPILSTSGRKYEILGSEVTHEIHDLYDGLQLYTKRVNGGYVVTFRISNPPDRNGNYQEPNKSSYIITDEQDFYETLCKLMTMELVKN
jgi:hypothetical protein